MNPYLTKKSMEKPRFETFYLVMAILMTGSAISITIDDLSTEPADLGIDIFMTALFAWLAVHFLLKKWRRSQARRIAGRLVNTYDSMLNFDTLGPVAGTKNPERVVKYLADHGFLQNLSIDHANNRIILSTAKDMADLVVSVQCLNCGAKNEAVVGRVNKCRFCDQVLPKV